MRWTWVSHFDEGSLASETTRCLRQLGDLEQARALETGRARYLQDGCG